MHCGIDGLHVLGLYLVRCGCYLPNLLSALCDAMHMVTKKQVNKCHFVLFRRLQCVLCNRQRAHLRLLHLSKYLDDASPYGSNCTLWHCCLLLRVCMCLTYA